MRLALFVASLLAIVPAVAQDAPADTVGVPALPMPAPAVTQDVPPEPPRDRVPSRPASKQAATPRTVEPFGEFAVEFGGDEVAELVFTDGDSTTLTAGQGGTLALGMRVRPVAGVPVAAFGSVGVKFLFNPSENANIRLIRYPVEVGAHAAITLDVWAELAYTRHLDATLYGDDFFQDVEYSGTDGVTVAAGWRWIGLTGTWMTYTGDDGTEFDASTVGVTLRLDRDDF